MSIDKLPYKKPKLPKNNSCLTIEEARKSLQNLYETTVTVTRIKDACDGIGKSRAYFTLKNDPKEYSALL